MKKLFFERLYPYYFGFIGGLLWWEIQPIFPKSDPVISSTLAVAGIFVGFLAAIIAILISMRSSIITELKNSGYINDLCSYIGQAIWLSLSFCVFDVTGYFVDRQGAWFGVMWSALFVVTLMAFIRVTDLMLKILRYN